MLEKHITGHMVSPLLLGGYGLINEHYWYVILYLIEEFAPVADETGSRVVQPDISFALWTAENVEQLLFYRHGSLRQNTPLYFVIPVVLFHRGLEKVSEG